MRPISSWDVREHLRLRMKTLHSLPGTEVAGGLFDLSDCWLRYNGNEVNKKGVIETN